LPRSGTTQRLPRHLARCRVARIHADGQRRIRRKVSGQTKTAVKDKLKALHADLDMGITPKTGYANYTVRHVSLMSHHGVSIEEIARLAGHASTRTTEVVYRRELRPVITTGAEIMDEVFRTG
jgi:hypothetical protein